MAMSVVSLFDLLRFYPRGIDLVIPLDAAQRWLAGGQPYLAEAFVRGAAVPPFLYPPYSLVLLAPLTAIPRMPLEVIWFVASVGVSAAACRRLNIAWWTLPLILLWPPFTEAFVGANVQTAIFAAFVFALVEPNGSQTRRPLRRGLLAAATAFLKVSQPHVVINLVRRNQAAAVVAIGAIVILAAATLPLTGTGIWAAWFEQLGRASDPAWTIGGSSVGKLLPAPFDTMFVVGSAGAALFVPRRQAAEWVGVLLVIGSPGLRTYYMLFLLPAMLGIRREIALIAAFCLATYTQQGWWLGIAIVVAALATQTIYEAFSRRAAASATPTV